MGSNSHGRSLLDEIVREGVQRMLAVALQAEVAAYVEAHAGEVDERGRRLVLRNGHRNSREVVIAAGAVQVRQLRVNDKRVDPVTGERKRSPRRFCRPGRASRRRCRRCCRCCTCMGCPPVIFAPALEQFLGTGHGLSAATINRLTEQWQAEAAAGTRGDVIRRPAWKPT
jgi:putative transposase